MALLFLWENKPIVEQNKKFEFLVADTLKFIMEFELCSQLIPFLSYAT